MMAHEYIVFKTNEEDIFIPVCIYHFAFGLRFPLHPFFSQILCHFYLFLNQLLPQATRKIMSFIWTCKYMKLPLTLNLFKSLFKLDENKNKPFITFSSINGAMVVYPELNDLKEYNDKIIRVKVPKTPSHPFRYMPPVFWSKFKARETFGLDEILHLSRRERHAFLYFVKPKDRNLPSWWISHVVIFQQDIYLFLVGISSRLTPGVVSNFSYFPYLMMI